MFKKIFILGVGFTTSPENLILEYIAKSVKKTINKYYIVTPNPELLVIAHNDRNFKKILNSAKLALPDGIGVILAGKILGKAIKRRIHGVDLVDKLCERVIEKPITVGFLGGEPGVAEKTAKCLMSKYPNLKIGFVGEQWSKEGFVRARKYQVSSIRHQVNGKNGENIPNAKYLIHNTIDILFVAFGSPKQEIWISENLEKLPVKVAIGVGGAFDFISGKVKRAPVWMRKIGLEWLFRLIIQPWRVKRQLSLLVFVFLVLKERFVNKGK